MLLRALAALVSTVGLAATGSGAASAVVASESSAASGIAGAEPSRTYRADGGGAYALSRATQAGLSSASALTGIYRGDDGGALYLRQIGSQVYGFAEHPGVGYAFVLNGTVSGSEITGSWWDVPKGTRTLRGALALKWSQAGARIVRSGGVDFGPDVFAALPAGTSMPWPGRREAGFQAKSWSDLDGAFRGNDGSSHYVRERAKTVVWYGESIPQLGVRPTWATVFVGTVTSSTAVRGVWVDVPKGTSTRTGGFVAVRQQVDRSLVLGQAGASRTRELAPDWALDMDAFIKTVRDAFDGNVVGYGWAVAKHGAVIRAGAGGNRRLAQDGGVLPFTRKTQNSSASTTKLVTAAAVMRLLQEKKLPVTTKVVGYLPSCWKKTGKDLDKLTFKDLLDHSSKIDRAVARSACAKNPYECLRKSIEAGQTGSAGYDNINYSVFRYLVPLVENYKKTDAIFTKYNCGDFKVGNLVSLANGTNINRKVARRFETYLQSRLLKPFGINAGYSSTGTDWAYGYDFSSPTRKGQAPNEKAFEGGGSGGMKWSADAYARFLAALDQEKIVKSATVRRMKSQLLGFDSAVRGAAGSYYTKSGGSGNFASRAMVYPGRTAVYITLNSSKNAIPSPVSSVLQSAFDAALK